MPVHCSLECTESPLPMALLDLILPVPGIRGRTSPQASEPAEVGWLLGSAMRNGGPCPGRRQIDRCGDTHQLERQDLSGDWRAVFEGQARPGLSGPGRPKAVLIGWWDPILGRVYAPERGNRAARSR